MQVYYSGSEEETRRIGREIGSRIEPPLTILLYGELGAGKTVLARGLAEGLGIPDSSAVHSPSFTLVNQYHCRFGTLYHVDLYRLEGWRDLQSIGIEEIIAEPSIVIVEWAEKLLLQPQRRLTIRIFTDQNPSARRLEIESPIQAPDSPN